MNLMSGDMYYLGTLQMQSVLEIVHMGFPGGLAGKQSPCNAGDVVSIPGLGRSPEKGNGPTPVFWLKNSKGCIVHGVSESDTTE